MAHTFDIRFDRAGGIAAFFEAPGNSFHWKGSGLLSIDPQGVSIGVRRGLLSALARRQAQRIPAANLKDVYREGKALRVEFATDEKAREVLPFWVQDPDTAAAIVKLLPTSRTVEMEHSTAPREPGRFRFDWRVVTLFGLAIALLVGAAFLLDRYRDANAPLALPPAIEVPPLIEAPATPMPEPATESGAESSPSFIEAVPAEVAPPPALPGTSGLADPATLALRLPPGTRAYDLARDRVLRFADEAAAIETTYRNHHRRFTTRYLSTDEFLAQLDDCEMRWWDFTFRTLDDEQLADPALVELRAALLASARHWRNFYSGYAEGLRRGDHVMIGQAFDELTLAEELRARIRGYFFP
jgi:hypothetical protein